MICVHRCLLVAMLCLTFVGSTFAQTPVDLNTWSKKGPAGNGNWVVDASGDFVTQTINGSPTYFVSPNDFFNTTVEGTFRVSSSGGDDDFIGFVFGWNEPGDNSTDATFLLFDWKRANQSSTEEGFRLSKVNGTTTPPFGNAENDNLPNYDSLATNTSTTLGWEFNTDYDFSLLYTSSQIKIDITGGTGLYQTGMTIFDVAPGDVGLGSFDTGQFGFYNHSQAQVRYESFTLTEAQLTTVPDDDGTLNFLARIGDSDMQAVNVSNTGGAGSLLTGQATAPSGAPFSGPAEGPGFSLGSGDDTDFTYTFSPTARGTFNDSIEIQSNEDTTNPINLQGVGVGPDFDSSVTPGDTINLGSIDLASVMMSTAMLDISNVTGDDNGGNDDLTTLTLTGFDITGADASKFSLLTTLDAILKGDTLTLTLKFNPGVVGTFNAVLTLFTDEDAPLGGSGNSYSWNLTGTARDSGGGGPFIPTPAALPAGLALLGLITLRRRHA